MTHSEIAAEILTANSYMTLATVTDAGAPWATPVHFAHDEKYVYWLSKPETTHSQNLARDDRLFVIVFDASQSVGDLAERRCLYIETQAELLSGDDELLARNVFADKFGDEDGRKVAELNYYRAAIGAVDESRSSEQRIYTLGSSNA